MWVGVSIQVVSAVVSVVMVVGVVVVGTTKFALRPSLRTFSIAVVEVVAVVAVEATSLVLTLLMITTVGGTGTLDATNPVANMVDDFNVCSVRKKEIANDAKTAPETFDPVKLVANMTSLVNDAGVTVVVKTLGNWTSLDPSKMYCVLSSKETVTSVKYCDETCIRNKSDILCTFKFIYRDVQGRFVLTEVSGRKRMILNFYL